MNGEGNRIRHAPTLADGATPTRRDRKHGWGLFTAQLWLLAAFVAMSLVVAGAKALIVGDQPRGVSAVMAVAGVALFPLAWHKVARMLDAADAGRSARPAAQDARLRRQLNLALHR